jgi:hypothetical protein
MNSEENSVELEFRSYTEDRGNDLSITLTSQHVDNDRLKKLLNTWLVAIDSTLVVVDSANIL